MIKLDDITDKEKIQDLEIAADQGKIDGKIIFDIYKQISFSINTLINAENVYQTYESTEARSLIYQKYLLSEDVNTKLKYLFLLEELFQKAKLQNIFSKVLSDEIIKIGLENIPDNYQEVAQKYILSEKEKNQGKVKFNDKILHQSRIIKFYIEKEEGRKYKEILIKF